ncbi:MAG TPA: hypothetical protein VI075_07710, partial [Methyloceanibacter sp.]
GQFGANNHITGRFERLDATSWLEVNHESEPNRNNRFSFVEKSRRGKIIELLDTRAMWIRLDLNTRQIFWSTDAKKSWLRDYRDKPARPRYCPQCREAREGAGHRLVK